MITLIRVQSMKKIAILLAVTISMSPFGQDEPKEESILKGIKGIALLTVKDFGPDVKNDSWVLTPKQVNEIVELKLRTNRIKVEDMSSPNPSANFGYLSVDFQFVKESEESYFYVFEAELWEMGRLKRNLKERVIVTWQNRHLGLSSATKIRTQMKDLLDQAMTTLCNDLLKANPDVQKSNRVQNLNKVSSTHQ